jgi:hypothetical protein
MICAHPRVTEGSTLFSFLFLVAAPVAGIAAAVLIAGWPERPLTKVWALVYAALATVYSFLWTVSNWSPSDGMWNGTHMAAVALAGIALVMATRLRLPPAKTPLVVRMVGIVACLVSGVLLGIIMTMGTIEG